MKLGTAWTLGAALALAACGGNNDEEMLRVLNKIEAESANETANAAANLAAAPIDRSLLVGRWSDEFGCQGIITEFDEDGTMRADGRVGSWSLEGSTLTVTGNGRTQEMRLTEVSTTDLDAEGEDGQMLHSYRCNEAPAQ